MDLIAAMSSADPSETLLGTGLLETIHSSRCRSKTRQSRKAERIRANADVADFELSANDMAALDALGTGS